jgi:hypothetical protein
MISKKIIGVQEASDPMWVSEAFLYKQLEHNLLHSIRIGKLIRFEQKELIERLKNGKLKKTIKGIAHCIKGTKLQLTLRSNIIPITSVCKNLYSKFFSEVIFSGGLK